MVVSSSERERQFAPTVFFRAPFMERTRRSHQPPHQGESGVINLHSGAKRPNCLCNWEGLCYETLGIVWVQDPWEPSPCSKPAYSQQSLLSRQSWYQLQINRTYDSKGKQRNPELLTWRKTCVYRPCVVKTSNSKSGGLVDSHIRQRAHRLSTSNSVLPLTWCTILLDTLSYPSHSNNPKRIPQSRNHGWNAAMLHEDMLKSGHQQSQMRFWQDDWMFFIPRQGWVLQSTLHNRTTLGNRAALSESSQFGGILVLLNTLDQLVFGSLEFIIGQITNHSTFLCLSHVAHKALYPCNYTTGLG